MRKLLITCLVFLAATGVGANSAEHAAEPHPPEANAASEGEVITAVPAPAASVAPTTVSAVRNAAPEPFYAAHRLKGIRVQTLGDSLRVILVFDRIAPYNLRITPGSRVAELDLISTEVGYLAPELVQLNKSELSGIWLTRATEALSVLELRLPTDTVRIEHFTLPEMGALVLDLYRTDAKGARLTQRPLISSTEAQPGALPLNVMLARGATAITTQCAVLVAQAPEPTPATDQTEHTTDTSESTHAGAPESTSDTLTAHADPEHGRVAAHDGAPVMPPVSPAMLGDEHGAEHADAAHGAEQTHLTSEATTGAQTIDGHPLPQTLHVAQAGDEHGEVRSLDKDYDYFPVSTIRVESPLAHEILEAFQFKDWEAVINKSVREYFKRNPMGREGTCVLYMLAEARWQLARRGAQELYDLNTVYEQALAAGPSGPLAAFAHWRMAQMAAGMNDPQDALFHLSEAARSPEPGLRDRVAMLRAEMLQGARKFPEALKQIDTLLESKPDAWSQAPLLLAKAAVLEQQGETTKAWDAYTSATQLDANWISLDVDAAMRMARLGLETQHLEAARAAVEYLRANFSFRGRPEVGVELMLLYARILAAQGEHATAEQYFRKYLTANEVTTDTATSDTLQAELLKLNPAEVAASKQRYCELLWTENRFREAMAEFDRTYTQSIQGGIDTRALNELAGKIVPSFMQYSVAIGQPGDAAEAWRRFGELVTAPAARGECLQPLAEALAELGLYEQALTTLDKLPAPACDYPSTQLKRAKVLAAMGRHAEALKEATQILPALQDGAYRAQGQELQAACYEALGRPLEAAQAWRALASEDSIAGQRRGEVLLRAGDLFLKAGAPDQAISTGLNGLLREQEAAAKHIEPGWDQATASGLRMVLARGFLAQRDDARARMVLQDYIARPATPAEERAEAGVMLGDIERRLGDNKQAAAAYKAVAEDTNAPELWRGIARQNAATLEWNAEKPQWAVKF